MEPSADAPVAPVAGRSAAAPESARWLLERRDADGAGDVAGSDTGSSRSPARTETVPNGAASSTSSSPLRFDAVVGEGRTDAGGVVRDLLDDALPAGEVVDGLAHGDGQAARDRRRG